MNRDEIRGKAQKAKGFIKEETGELLDDPELESVGRAERAEGKLREGFGKAKRKVAEKLEDAADAIDE
ncbi:MAG TPA: CsbD family protein [Methylomirabilota bacterium]|nr:CsbD family protein [Methylomirabilota bacterium]